jgi:hypothetical protein
MIMSRLEAGGPEELSRSFCAREPGAVLSRP